MPVISLWWVCKWAVNMGRLLNKQPLTAVPKGKWGRVLWITVGIPDKDATMSKFWVPSGKDLEAFWGRNMESHLGIPKENSPISSSFSILLFGTWVVRMQHTDWMWTDQNKGNSGKRHALSSGLWVCKCPNSWHSPTSLFPVHAPSLVLTARMWSIYRMY
jgi:hypothetical protein